MKILAIVCFMIPLALAAQNVGVHTTNPQHPFQVNVDSFFTNEQIDQSVTGLNSLSLSVLPGLQKAAQSLTVGATGQLKAVEVKFNNITEADEIVIEVFQGAGPEGTLMVADTLTDVLPGTYIVEFAQPWPDITSGEMINIVITPVSGSACSISRNIFATYPGGIGYHWNGSWVSLSYELHFKTFVSFPDTIEYPILNVLQNRTVQINDYALPQSDGTEGEFMMTDGNGVVSWVGRDTLSPDDSIQDEDGDTRIEVEAVPDEDVIRLSTAGEERMTILENGKVGINTIAPASDLDIRGDDDVIDGGELQLATPSMSNFIRMFGGRIGDPNPFLAFSDLDTFRFVTTSPDWMTFTRRMTITPDGKIGIGTETPLSRLDIKALGDGAELLRFTTDRPWVIKQTGTGISTALTLQPTTNDKAFQVMSENGLNLSARFFTNNTYSKVALVPDGGEVGIGILEATAKLHVRGNNTTSDPQLRLTETSTNDFARIKMENENEPGIFWDIAGRADSSATESRLNFYYGNPGYTGDKMTITGAGNVGIGISNPTEKLHVEGDMRVSGLSGSGDRNVIVDSNGKFKTGNIGYGGWVETGTQVSTTLEVYVDSPSGPTSSMTIDGKISNGNNFSALSLYNNTQFPGGTYDRMLLDANDMDAFSGSGSSPISENLNIQRFSNGDLLLVNGGGKVGIGTSTPASKLTINGGENNGVSATLEINNSGQKLLIDGNEIDAMNGTLVLNGNNSNGVAIGTQIPANGYKLSVDGKIIAEEVRVQLSGAWPDYVFDPGYALMKLDVLKAFIHDKKHLPGIPSAEEMHNDGLALGEIQIRQMQKIEELTLHIIALHEQMNKMEAKLLACCQNDNRK